MTSIINAAHYVAAHWGMLLVYVATGLGGAYTLLSMIGHVAPKDSAVAKFCTRWGADAKKLQQEIGALEALANASAAGAPLITGARTDARERTTPVDPSRGV